MGAPVEWTTRSVDEADAFDYWRDMICDAFVQLSARPRSPEPFSGHIAHSDLDSVQLSTVTAGPQQVDRTTSLIVRSHEEFVLASIQLDGRGVVHQSGRLAVLDAGSMAFYDSTRPYTLGFDGTFRQLVVQVPKRALTTRLLADGTAVPLGRDGPARLVSDFFVGLARGAGTGADMQALAPHAIGLLDFALGLAADDARPTQAAVSRRVRDAVAAVAVQAEPRWMDLDAGVAQVVEIIGDAAARGVQLVAFPETFLPGYPWWIWLDAPAMGMQFVPSYAENSMTRDGEHMQRIARAAGEHRVHVVLGFSERSGGSLYMSQAFISDDGRVVSVRRKLKPTHVERSVFGEGDGSDLQVHDTSLGRVGALNCWEHLQPLTKYAMFSQNEQIHVGSWPSFSVYRGAATALGPEVNNAASLMYAVEGQTFVVAPCATVGQAAHDLFCDTDVKRQLLLQGGGFARIYGPEGSPLGENLPETGEGLVVADLDFSMIAIAKSAADPVGHYSRPDVMRLLINRAPNPAVVEREVPAPAFVDAEEG